MERSKKRNAWIFAAVVAALLVAVVVGSVTVYHVFFKKQADAYAVLTSFFSRDNPELHVSVQVDLGDVCFSEEADFFYQNESNLCGLIYDGRRIYYRENMICLPSGYMFRVEREIPQTLSSESLKRIFSVAFSSQQMKDGAVQYQAELPPEQTLTAMQSFSPELFGRLSKLEHATILLTAGDGEPERLSVSISGIWDEDTHFSVDLSGLVLSSGTLDTTVPDSVLQSFQNPGEVKTLEWNSDFLPLLRGGIALISEDAFQADLSFTVECGILSLVDSLNLQFNRADGIGRLKGSKLEIYCSKNGLCTADGTVLTSYYGVSLDDFAKSLLIRLLSGDIDAICSGDDGLYTLNLSREELDAIISAVSSESGSIALMLSNGTAEMRVTNNCLTQVQFNCTGSISILTAEISASVEAALVPYRAPQLLEIPDAVKSALSANAT